MVEISGWGGLPAGLFGMTGSPARSGTVATQFIAVSAIPFENRCSAVSADMAIEIRARMEHTARITITCFFI
jgi:hypothetical protein